MIQASSDRGGQVMLSCRISKDLRHRLKLIAVRRGLRMAEIVETAIEDWVRMADIIDGVVEDKPEASDAEKDQ